MFFKSRKTEWTVTIVGYLLLATPLTIGIFGVKEKNRELKEYGKETLGVVVRYERGNIDYCIYELNINGAIYEGRLHVGNVRDYPIGQFYKAVYSAKDPNVSRLLDDYPIPEDSLKYYFDYYDIKPLR